MQIRWGQGRGEKGWREEERRSSEENGVGVQQGCHLNAGDVIPKISSNNSHRQCPTGVLCCPTYCTLHALLHTVRMSARFNSLTKEENRRAILNMK